MPHPTAERLAGNGLSFSRFHTTALCAPTRQALLTGRNHHAVGMGAITEIATAAPGYTSVRPQSAAPLAEVLRLNGYATAQFGKCHEVPVWQTSPVGPFDAWPTGGGGFEHFFGFLGGETNQYAPALYSGTTPIEQDATADEGYHFTEDMTDRAIAWVAPALGAHPRPALLHVLRTRCDARAAPRAAGVGRQVPRRSSTTAGTRCASGSSPSRSAAASVPDDAELTARHDEIPAWDDMPAELKPVLARQMEVYAGFLEHTDHHIGRLVDALDGLGALENTLVFYIIGDNGASAEGHINGSFNEYLFFNGAAALETPEFLASRIDQLGTPEAYNHFSVGWAHAMDTPYQWTKQVASHWGGTRNGDRGALAEGIRSTGVRHQFHHVIDIAPTILEAAGIPHPERVNGAEQSPLHGVSMRYAFDDADAPDRHTTQYFEIGGNRGIYHEGWTAVTKHATPWIAMAELPAFVDDVWELYAPDDWTQADDLADRMPDKLRELQELFLVEARKYDVLPLDDRRVERFDAAIAGRPQLITGRTDPVRRHGSAHRGNRHQHQERVARSRSRHRGAGRRRLRSDHRPGRGLRRMEPLPAPRRRPRLLLQPAGAAGHEGGRIRATTRGQPPSRDGLRLRRRRTWSGWRSSALVDGEPWSKAGSSAPCPSCSPSTRPATSAATAACR